MLVDCHCHLTFPDFDSDRRRVIKEAARQEVLIINSSVSPSEVENSRKLAEAYYNVFWTLGLSASSLEADLVEETIELVSKHREAIVGLGEVGLDYYWVKDEEGRRKEMDAFKKFIEVSIDFSLPLVVHSRDAEEDCLRILDEYGKCALLHCFSGSVEQALSAASAGHIISIPANVTYVKSRQKLAKDIPIESIVLETDAPYLAPTPKSRNEPVNVGKACEKIAELKGVSRDYIAEKTTENARKFFEI